MVSTGKAGSIETALQGRGNIHVVLEPVMASPAVSRQALPCMWTITSIICGFVEHPYLWIYIVKNPLTLGAKLSKEPLVPTTDAASSMLPDDTLHAEGPTNPTWLYESERVKSKCCCCLIQ